MIELDSYSHILIIDLESTCCESGSPPKGEHEIIELEP